MAAAQRRSGGPEKMTDPWMLEEDYFVQKNRHQKKRKKANFKGRIGVHYNLTPNANSSKG